MNTKDSMGWIFVRLGCMLLQACSFSLLWFPEGSLGPIWSSRLSVSLHHRMAFTSMDQPFSSSISSSLQWLFSSQERSGTQSHSVHCPRLCDEAFCQSMAGTRQGTPAPFWLQIKIKKNILIAILYSYFRFLLLSWQTWESGGEQQSWYLRGSSKI